MPGSIHSVAPALAVALSLVAVAPAAPPARAPAPPDSAGPSFSELVGLSRAQRWDTLSIGQRVGRLGMALEGAPYVEGSLEGPGPERCRVTFRGFDCVTLIETCLDLARILPARSADSPPPTLEDLRRAVTFTRYRGGRLDGYASRLHYTAEWIADNVARGVIEDVTPALGGEPLAVAVGFMSAHPERYPALASQPALVDSMRRIERRVNTVPRRYVPKGRVAAIEPRLETGDLIAITTSVKGLDYSHTGMIYRGADGVPRFLHASSKHGRVVLDGRLSGYLAKGPKSNTGITVVRPLEVAGSR